MANNVIPGLAVTARPYLSTGWALNRRFGLISGTAAVLVQGGGVDELVAWLEELCFPSAIGTRAGIIDNPAGRPQTQVIDVGRHPMGHEGGIVTQVFYPRVCSPYGAFWEGAKANSFQVTRR